MVPVTMRSSWMFANRKRFSSQNFGDSITFYYISRTILFQRCACSACICRMQFTGLGVPTNILQRKISRCIYSCPACYNCVPSKLSSAIFNSIKKSLAMHFIFWLKVIIEHFNPFFDFHLLQRKIKIKSVLCDESSPIHHGSGSDFFIFVYLYPRTWTKRVGNLDYESINFCRFSRYTLVKGWKAPVEVKQS